MNRREFIAGATIAAGGMAAAQQTRRMARRPNLVYVFADQLRYRSCGYAGDEYARTPNMDRLAGEGCNFHQTVSSTPVCAPYRASLMTGKYQSSTGMVINELRLSPEHECFGHVLEKAGYKTAYIGKWHLWANQLGHHGLIKNGFVPPGKYRLGFDEVWAAYNFNHVYYHSPYFLNDATPHIRKKYEPDAQTDSAISYVKERARDKQPFALFLSWGPPHYPWGWDNVPPDYKELFREVKVPRSPSYSNASDPYADQWAQLPKNYDAVVDDWQRAYYGQTANLDWNLGRLMKALDEAGLREDTIVVFTSDHGEMFGAHGRQAKYIFYEEAARVPMLMRWPGKIPAKHVSDTLLGTPDIMPTILSMMQLPIPKAVEGVDLSAQAMGRSGDGPVVAHLQGMGTTAAWADGAEWRAVRDREYTYAIYHRDRKELLFEHRTDPYQMTDLAGDRSHTATLRYYRETSEAWRKEQNDTFEACSYYERWTTDRNITMTAKGVSQNLDTLKKITDKWFANGVGDRKVESLPVGVP
jgi:arylsulfatase A-like enzyme